VAASFNSVLVCVCMCDYISGDLAAEVGSVLFVCVCVIKSVWGVGSVLVICVGVINSVVKWLHV